MRHEHEKRESAYGIAQYDSALLKHALRKRQPRLIVIHHTATKTPQRTLSALQNRGYSTHFEIDQNATLYRYLNPVDAIAFHAGYFNEMSIGIDLTHQTGAPFPDQQMKALAGLVDELCFQFKIPHTLAASHAEFHVLGVVDGKKILVNNARDAWAQIPITVGIVRHSNIAQTRCPDGAPLEQYLVRQT